MAPDRLTQWLEALGYAEEPGALHVAGGAVPATHPFATELRTLLRPDGDVRARAVYDVEGVPTVVFLVDAEDRPLTGDALDAVRQRLWNQNLVSVVLAITDTRATALPVARLKRAAETLQLAKARPDGHFSAAEVRSSDLARRLGSWFRPHGRVDHRLLKNIELTVGQLRVTGMALDDAQLLMGQLLFIAYLEHRRIVSPHYRMRREVGEIHHLVARADRAGVQRLIARLRRDFNGDFLASEPGEPDLWALLPPAGFEVLDRFLSQVDMATGQQDFWNYDFSYIPVELLSGLYESFLDEGKKAETGAYYTPRHLAALAVDEALRACADPCEATVFDGACGSGILLTTTFRRMLALIEARDGRQLPFAERCRLLTMRIFGGDTNAMACRVTAFSLYLALLEGLEPADVLALQEQDDVKLPRLRDRTLFGGADADIFAPGHPLAGRQFSLGISNPPWKEPAGGTHTSADAYAEATGLPFVRRQFAGLYTFRLLDFLAEGGTACLILPIPLFVGPTSGPFAPALMARARPHRLINFGDLQGLLFPTGENACHVFTATRRAAGSRIAIDETFDYWVPKADLSLAFGRLTLLSADRHVLQTQALLDDPQWLVTLMWGDKVDAALLARLGLRGSLADFYRGPGARWRNRKGVHLEDRSREAVSARRLREMPHVAIERLRDGLPVLHGRDLTAFPAAQKTVVGLSDGLLEVFDGPRIVFPDGFSRQEAEVRTNYLEGPASFTSSVGVIAGRKEDAPLLRFLTLYLRSSLAKYFLVMRVWKVLSERNALHLKDLDDLPFYAPEQAADPARGHAVLARVSELMQELRSLGREDRAARFNALRPAIDALVFDYFGLTAQERQLVQETVEVLLPSVRPRAFGSLDTPAQRRARPEHLDRYATALARELDAWRDALGGRGRFEVSVRAMDARGSGPVGAVRIALAPDAQGPAQASVKIEDAAVEATLRTLREQAVLPQTAADLLQLSPDTLIWTPDALYLVRPLVRRAWMVRTATQDAERIVRDVQAAPRRPAPLVAA